MKLDILLGLQWGDEGKGKIVDVFTRNYDVVARFQGGPNAGHTLIFDGEKHILHTIPSGIFHKNKENLIGNGVVIEPLIFMNEIEGLKDKIPSLVNKLLISRKAHLILPTHRLLDAAYEKSKGQSKIGSTLKGIGPTYTDKVARNGLRVGDIESEIFEEKYASLVNKHLSILKYLDFDIGEHRIEGIAFDAYEKKWLEAVKKVKQLQLVDSEMFINDKLSSSKKVLAEGAQGALLDVDFGTYPYVTSSNTIASSVCSGLGVAPNKIGEVFGVFKAYCTRVGSGPFPTELMDETGTYLGEKGAEFGSTTGRQRRCGWLDLPALKHACMINGVTQLIMMKADVLTGLKNIKTATHYLYKNETIQHIPFDVSPESLKPVYTEFEGWDEGLNDITRYDDIPEALKSYIGFIENYLNIPICIVSVGPDRKQTLFRNT